MTKTEFILALSDKLSSLPRRDIKERLTFYTEMINDRMEEGLSEEEAVRQVGNIDDIAAEIQSETSVMAPPPEKEKPKKPRKAWATVLLILGSPLWFSLLIAAFAVIFSIYVSAWAVIISLGAVFASLFLSALAALASAIGLWIGGESITGLLMLGFGFVSAGLSILFFYLCKASAKGTILLTKNVALKIKNRFAKREVV